jgi:hypothetical protein
VRCFGEVTLELVHESVTRLGIEVDVVGMVCHRNVQYQKISWITNGREGTLKKLNSPVSTTSFHKYPLPARN